MKRELEEKEQNLMMDKVQEGLKEVGTEREVYIIIKLQLTFTIFGRIQTVAINSHYIIIETTFKNKTV